MYVKKLLKKDKFEYIFSPYLFGVLFVSFACIEQFILKNFNWTQSTIMSGYVGTTIAAFLNQYFGSTYVLVVATLSAMFCIIKICNISILSIIHKIVEKFRKDLNEYKEKKQELAIREKLVRNDSETFIHQPSISTDISVPNPNFKIKIQEYKKTSKENDGEKDTQEVISDYHHQGDSEYQLPPLNLLKDIPKSNLSNADEKFLCAQSIILEKTMLQFGVKAKVVKVNSGPVINRYDVMPAIGVRVQAIETLANDIALVLKATFVRILAPVPGEAAVGIEVPNPNPQAVYLRELLQSSHKQHCILPLCIGKTIDGKMQFTDLTSMPHLLIAGATNSGKSVCIHTIVMSILYRFRPDQVKLVLIDPKRIEMSAYHGIPHLYDPAIHPKHCSVITNPKETIATLEGLVSEMNKRYKYFVKYNVRNISSYNIKAKKENLPPIYYVVVIIDELADLMITVGKDIENLIQRLAQMARAVGIHLILATQRPSVDVVTGVIKANLPSRIAFQVLSKTDSRVILDVLGAETLLGKGDMLFFPTNFSKPSRVQGGFISEEEVNEVVDFIVKQGFSPEYEFTIEKQSQFTNDTTENIQLLRDAALVVQASGKASGDLLRANSNIRSKYEIALILLQKRNIISKREGSNRWQVNMEELNKFLDHDYYEIVKDGTQN